MFQLDKIASALETEQGNCFNWQAEASERFQNSKAVSKELEDSLQKADEKLKMQEIRNLLWVLILQIL